MVVWRLGSSSSCTQELFPVTLSFFILNEEIVVAKSKMAACVLLLECRTWGVGSTAAAENARIEMTSSCLERNRSSGLLYQGKCILNRFSKNKRGRLVGEWEAQPSFSRYTYPLIASLQPQSAHHPPIHPVSLIVFTASKQCRQPTNYQVTTIIYKMAPRMSCNEMFFTIEGSIKRRKHRFKHTI